MAVKKYSKVKFTLRKELIFIIAGLLVLGIGIALLKIDSKKTKFYKEYTKAGASLPEDHHFVKTSLNDLYKTVAKEELVYVFYATSSSETATSNIGTIENYASDSKLKKVYYLDSSFATEKDRNEDSDFDSELKAIEDKLGLSSYVDPLQKDLTDDKFEASLDNTVSVWVFKDGKLVYVLNQDLIDLEGNWSTALTRAFVYAYDAKNNK